jgi:hypothetical protein
VRKTTPCANNSSRSSWKLKISPLNVIVKRSSGNDIARVAIALADVDRVTLDNVQFSSLAAALPAPIAGTGSATVSVGGTAPVLQNNAWQLFTGTSAAKLTDFIDSDATAAMNAARRADGGLPEDFFMRPVFGSRFIDRGVAITGDTWLGTAPDLGAYEAPAWGAATATLAR